MTIKILRLCLDLGSNFKEFVEFSLSSAFVKIAVTNKTLLKPRGHNLKPLASKVKSLSMVSKPGSRRRHPVLGSRQHYFLTFWKWAKVMTNFVSSWRTPESLRKNFWWDFFPWRTLEFSGKFTKFRSEDLFLEITSTFCSWSLALASNIPVLGLERVCLRKGCPWPRIFLCPWPPALCPRLHLWSTP